MIELASYSIPLNSVGHFGDKPVQESFHCDTTTTCFTTIIQVRVKLLAGTSSWELENFIAAKFYCLHALADVNYRIRFREKILEFSLMVIPVPSLQGCSLGLDVSVSRRSRDVVSKCLGLVSVSWKRGKVWVSISSPTENQTSRSRLVP